MEQRNVFPEVVKNDLCIGCGVCAGVCQSEVYRTGCNELEDGCFFSIG